MTLNDGAELGCRALVVASGVNQSSTRRGRRADRRGHLLWRGADRKRRPIAASTSLRQGANSAGQGPVLLALCVQGDDAGAGLVARQEYVPVSHRPDRATENIEVLTRHTVVEAMAETAGGRGGGQQRDRRTVSSTHRLFLFIGAVPHSDCVAGVVGRNSAGCHDRAPI